MLSLKYFLMTISPQPGAGRATAGAGVCAEHGVAAGA